MSPGITRLASAIAGIPGFPTDDASFPSANVTVTSGYITIPIGILLIVIARVFWAGRYLGLVAGYKDYGVAEPERMGRFVGSLVGALGVFLLIFPLTVWWLDELAFVVLVFAVVGIGVAILIGSAHFGKG
jgi:hypothetical protein